MNDECPRCREYAARGDLFCGACGKYLSTVRPGSSENVVAEKRSGDPAKNFLSIILQVACVFVLIIAVIELIALFVNSGDVFLFLEDKYLNFFLIIPFPTAVFSMSGVALQAYWLLLILVIFVCVVTVVLRFFRDTKSGGGIAQPGSAEKSPAFWVTVFISAMLLINFIIVILTEAAGSSVEVPDFGEQVEQVFLFANAAVWEEIITRMLYIGVPMTILSLIMTKKADSLKCLLGGFGMSKVAVLLIIISGAIFGLAHYPGWEDQVWKVIASGIMGMFLGYLFVRFGLYASILLHFITNYLSAFDWLGMDGVGIIVSLMLLILGGFALLYIILRLFGSGGEMKGLPLFRNGHIKGDRS